MTSAHSTRNTSIRTRKIRGEDNLLSSISISERGGPEGIAGVFRCEKPRVVANMAQRAREKRSKGLISGEDHGNLTLKAGFLQRILDGFNFQPRCWDLHRFCISKPRRPLPLRCRSQVPDVGAVIRATNAIRGASPDNLAA